MAKTHRFELKTEEAFLHKLDNIITHMPGVGSRTQAVERAVEVITAIIESERNHIRSGIERRKEAERRINQTAAAPPGQPDPTPKQRPEQI